MKIILKYFSIASLFILIEFIGCSDRIETDVVLSDSTIVHPPKFENGASATISFSTKIDKESGELFGTGTLFKIREDGNVFARIEVANLDKQNNLDLLFHIDWLDPENNSFFRKQIILTSSDSSSIINSSISIPPGKREPGRYALRIYLFRELIAVKYFILSTTEEKIIDKVVDNIEADITLCRKISKKSGKLIGIDSVFTIAKKTKVHAIVNLKNLEIRGKRNLTFYFDWIGPDDSSFYRKEVNYSNDDNDNEITSSISIYPSKRQPGNYKLQVYLFDKLKCETKFALRKKLVKSK